MWNMKQKSVFSLFISLAALLERLWWGWPLYTGPGTAEYNWPDDSKVRTHMFVTTPSTHNCKCLHIACIHTYAYQSKNLKLILSPTYSWFHSCFFHPHSSPTSLPPSQFCAQPIQSRGAFCHHFSEGGMEGSMRVLEGNKKRMLVDVRLENKGENAYNACLNITYTANLRFSSLIVKVWYHPKTTWDLWWEQNWLKLEFSRTEFL